MKQEHFVLITTHPQLNVVSSGRFEDLELNNNSFYSGIYYCTSNCSLRCFVNVIVNDMGNNGNLFTTTF